MTRVASVLTESLKRLLDRAVRAEVQISKKRLVRAAAVLVGSRRSQLVRSAPQGPGEVSESLDDARALRFLSLSLSFFFYPCLRVFFV